MHIHVLMLCGNFELILIKFGFLKKFKVAPKSCRRPCTIVQCLRPNFIKNQQERIYHFNNFFLMHIHVLMLCRNFELIPIKFGFLKNFKFAPKSDQRHCTIVQGLWPNFIKNGKERILHFYNFF